MADQRFDTKGTRPAKDPGSGDTIKPRRRYSPEEDRIIIDGIAEEGGTLTTRELSDLIPGHNEVSIIVRYRFLATRDLSTDEFRTLGDLWTCHKETMFSRYAIMCRVTDEQYERIAYNAQTSTAQTKEDTKRLNITFVKNNYAYHASNIWRTITLKMLIPWSQGERAWMSAKGAFARDT